MWRKGEIYPHLVKSSPTQIYSPKKDVKKEAADLFRVRLTETTMPFHKCLQQLHKLKRILASVESCEQTAGTCAGTRTHSPLFHHSVLQRKEDRRLSENISPQYCD